MTNRGQGSARRKSYDTWLESERFLTPLLNNELKHSIVKHFGRGRGATKILDLGCGEGPWEELLKDEGNEYYSFDIEQNQEKSVDFLGSIDGELGDEVLGRGPYGGVLCTEVLEHVFDWSRAFSNIYSLLETNGVVIITVPFIYMAHEEPNDFWRPTIHALKRHANITGLSMIETKKIGEWGNVLGSIMAVSYSLPIKRNITGRAWNRMLWLWREIGLRILDSRGMRENVGFYSDYYHSILMVMKKPV